MGIDAARWLKYQSAVLYVALKTYKTVFDMPFFLFFSVRLLSVLRGHSVFHHRHNSQRPPTSKDFLSQILSITFIFLS